MGLTISHGGFDGGYISFQMLRKRISDIAYEEFENYGEEIPEALKVFLQHSDCDGEIDSDTCKDLAAELTGLLKYIELEERFNPLGGHIERDGGTVQVVKNLISACETASSLNEPLEFY